MKDRYRGLLDSGAPISGDDYFSKDDYRYAPIEYFATLADVYLAMKIAKEDLEKKCDIIVREDGSIEDLSRLGRNYIEVGQYTELIFPRLGVRYIAINDNFDSLYSDGNELAPFKNLFNE